jgi:Mitochondrial carrier protein
MFGSTGKIVSGEGVTALWKGVDAAWLREASYTSLRLGLYEPCKIAFGCTTPENTTFLKKFAAGSAAGALGSLAGNPFDVLKTKMMASEAAGSPSIVGTAKDLLKNQGVGGFYRGLDSNIARATVLNGTKMACYDQTKQVIVQTTGLEKSSLLTQFLSAVTAGFFMTCTVSPFDMIRTRLMNQPADAKIYNNAVDCMVKIAREEGPLTFWRGFMPIWSRFAPTTTLQLIIFEQLRTLLGMKSL